MTGQILLDRPILVVDDTNSTRYSTVRFLMAAGARVLEATSGQQGLELVAQCGAVVLDVNLPDMDGFEVCRRIRAGTANPRVPVIHLSAQRLQDPDRIRGLESGADAYLLHPSDSGVLVATINALLRTRAAEQAEMLSRARFEAVFRTAPIGIALLASSGELLECNAEMQRIFGLPDDEAADGELAAHLRDVVSECRSSHEAPAMVSVAHPRGKAFLDCRVTDLDDDTHLLIAADRSTRRELELERERLLESERGARQHAEHLSRTKDSFLALLSHELRNPLAPISSAATLLQIAPSDATVVARSAGVILRQVRHMTELVDDLMDVSRVTRGLIDLHMEPLDLRRAVEAAVEQVRPLIDTRGHAFAVEMPDVAVVVEADRTRMIQVIANLLNNAAKYTPNNGSIRLALEASATTAVMRVFDTGIGMSDALSPHIFDLFTQGERTPDRAQGGLGVGLALVRSVVQLHGGTVRADSPGEGGGSTFTVTLPLSTSAMPLSQRATPGVSGLVPLRILIVDDNVDAAMMLADVLRLAGHTVTVMHDAPGALREALRPDAVFDVFVLDIGLPGMTGYGLLKELKHDAKFGRAIFIALTGYGQASDHEDSALAGFHRHLVKPTNESALLSTIAELTARR